MEINVNLRLLLARAHLHCICVAGEKVGEYDVAAFFVRPDITAKVASSAHEGVKVVP